MILDKIGYDYKFDTTKCSSCEGNCCIGESGYVWITQDEIKKLANFLNISIDQLANDSLRKIGYKYSLRELQLSKNNYVCKFFNLEKKQCSIYDVRPNQCRTFPFWEYFKQNLEEVKKECPAIITN